MSSITDPHPELPAEEELVAYLDGELPPEDCRRVETRLAADAAYRRQLHELDQTWESLDALTAARAGDDFARTTMEMVAVAAEGELAQHTSHVSAAGRRRWWLVSAAGVAAALVGFAATRALQSRGDAAVLADLPVIWQVDLLTQVESVEFLRRLPDEVPLDRWATDDAAAGDELLNLQWINAPEHEDRQEWVEALSDDKKVELAAQAKRFGSLPGAQRDRLRRLQREIQSADDWESLQLNLLTYGQWLSQLTVGEREELREGLAGRAADEQLDRVRRFVRRENQRSSRRLSADDAERLRRAVFELVEERRAQILQEMRRRGAADRARRLEGPRGAFIILNWALQNEQSAHEARERIVGQLSSDARDHLARLGPRSRQLQLWQWIRDSLQANWGPGELERYFADELSNDQRERLLNLPPGEMQAELERLYMASELGFRGGFEPGGGPRNPTGPGWPEFRPERGPRERFERSPDGPPRGPRGGDRDGRRPPPERPGPPPTQHERRDAI